MATVSELMASRITNAQINEQTWGGVIFNVKAFGAKGDYNTSTGLGTDDSTAIINAYQAAAKVNGTVEFPPGNYLINSTITLSDAVRIKGDRVNMGGSRIFTKANAPIFRVKAAAHIEGLSFMGSKEVSKTSQVAIYIDNISNVTIFDCYFQDFYDCIYIYNVVFYSTIERCRFYSAVRSMIRGAGVTASGYQVTINHCVVTPGSNGGESGFYFENAGTVTINDLEMSPTNLSDASIVFASIAANGGIQQITHSRLEGSSNVGLKLIGTSGNPIKFVFVSNTYIAGNPAVRMDYATNCYFDNCYFTGSSDGLSGRHALLVNHVGDNIKMNNCEYQVTNVPITADIGCSSISLDIVNPNYTSAHQFIYLPFLTSSEVDRISVFGGLIGIHTTPVDIPAGTKSIVQVEGVSERIESGSAIVTIPTGNAGALASITFSKPFKSPPKLKVWIESFSGSAAGYTTIYSRQSAVTTTGAAPGVTSFTAQDVTIGWEARGV